MGVQLIRLFPTSSAQTLKRTTPSGGAVRKGGPGVTPSRSGQTLRLTTLTTKAKATSFAPMAPTPRLLSGREAPAGLRAPAITRVGMTSCPKPSPRPASSTREAARCLKPSSYLQIGLARTPPELEGLAAAQPPFLSEGALMEGAPMSPEGPSVASLVTPRIKEGRAPPPSSGAPTAAAPIPRATAGSRTKTRPSARGPRLPKRAMVATRLVASQVLRPSDAKRDAAVALIRRRAPALRLGPVLVGPA